MKKEEFASRHPHPDQVGVSRLYKYLPFDPHHPERLAHLLVEGQLYHSLPSAFNDPWEAKPRARPPTSPTGIARSIERLTNSLIDEGMAINRAGLEAKKAVADPNKFSMLLGGAMEETLASVLISSLSSVKDNTLMWGHYSMGHKGLCVGFDAKFKPFFFAFKVRYQSKYPSVGYPLDEQEAFDVLATKSKAWKYEQEFRVLHHPGSYPPGKYRDKSAELDPNALTDVFLGAQISPHDKEEIMRLIDIGPFQPNVYQGKLSRSEFLLEFDRIK